jgi:hypothetical protein
MSTTKVSRKISMYKKILVFHCIVVSIVEDVNPWTNGGGTMWRGYQMLFLWLRGLLAYMDCKIGNKGVFGIYLKK